MAKNEERSRPGSIEDRKLFSFRDIGKFIIFLITMIVGILTALKVNTMFNKEPVPINTHVQNEQIEQIEENEKMININRNDIYYHRNKDKKHMINGEKKKILNHVNDKTIHFADENEKYDFKSMIKIVYLWVEEQKTKQKDK